MDIRIEDSKRIADIQNEFSQKYPYLKIEFFKHEHGAGQGSELGDMIDPELTLGDCRTDHGSGYIRIEPSSTVEQIESGFQETFGLSAQVFRKSGALWIETMNTDSWTLEEQNSTGEEMSNG